MAYKREQTKKRVDKHRKDLPGEMVWSDCMLFTTLRGDYVHAGKYDRSIAGAHTLCGKKIEYALLSDTPRLTCPECSTEYEKRFPGKWPRFKKVS